MAVYTGKAIVVTGASQGIGKALCLALAPQRPRLVLAARDAARLEEVAAAARAAGAETLVIPTDVTSADECRRLVETWTVSCCCRSVTCLRARPSGPAGPPRPGRGSGAAGSAVRPASS